MRSVLVEHFLIFFMSRDIGSVGQIYILAFTKIKKYNPILSACIMPAPVQPLFQ